MGVAIAFEGVGRWARDGPLDEALLGLLWEGAAAFFTRSTCR